MHLYRGVLILFLVALTSCRSSASSSIAAEFSASGDKGVDLASAVPGKWDRVCILGPYSSNAAAAETLGFTWPAETLTSIEDNEGISLLIFVQGESVIDYVEHRRDLGDFTNLTGRCFPRTSAKFLRVARPTKGWPGLFPADEA